MNIAHAIALLGKPINIPEMIDFFEQYGFKYPKKPAISGKNAEPTFWVENKKQKVDLLFSILSYLKLYSHLC